MVASLRSGGRPSGRAREPTAGLVRRTVMSPWPASATTRALRAATTAVVAVSLSSCAFSSPGREPAEGPLAERHTWGGMCAEGDCFSTLLVEADGTWTYEDERGSTRGELRPRQLDRVHDAVAATGLGSAPPYDGLCEADRDGTSVRYAWAGPDGWRTASSCEVRVDPGDPLPRVLDTLAESLGD